MHLKHRPIFLLHQILTSYMWRVALTIIFVFINIYDPKFILLYVNINFFYSQLYFFLSISKNTLTTLIHPFFCVGKYYLTHSETS